MIVADKNKMQYLSANTAAPFAMSRFGNEIQRSRVGLGDFTVDDANSLATGTGQIVAKIEAFFGVGGGRREADQIVPIANEITRTIFAPISAALEHGSALSYNDLQLMWHSLTTTEDRWLAFLHTTDWKDGRAAAQAERDFVPYFSSFKTRISALLGNISGTIPVGDVLIPGQTNTTHGSIPGSYGTLPVLQTVQTYLPYIMAAAFIFMLPKIGKH